jgi:signal transduction histidine kinase/CheY-like chemotaxis protein
MEITPNQEKKLRVLIVEDNPGDVYLIKSYLKPQIDFNVTNLVTLKDAIESSSYSNFDVVLLDLGLPDSFGLNTLKKMLNAGIQLPIIVMTGLDDEGIAIQAVKEGAQDYLVKNNITSEALIRSIRYSIERKNIQDIREKNARQFSILSAATVAINECEDVSFIYSVVCSNILKLLKNVQICYFDLINKVELTDYKNCNGLNTLLESAPFEFEFNGKINNLSNNLHSDLRAPILSCFDNKYPEGSLYALGFSREEKHYGGVFIFSELPLDNNDKDIIEAISNQASLSIHRRVIETQLKESESRYKILFNEATQAKEALQLLNDELDLKVQERTAEIREINNLLHLELAEHEKTMEKLKESAAHLKELNAMKDKFFGIIAHDLRNPFSILLGSAELLMNYIDNMSIADIKKISQSVYNSAKAGFTLLENLLEWSRSQTGSISFRPELLSVKELIDHNISALKVYYENKKIKLISGNIDDIEVSADRNMINTILRNLLNNAVKFTHVNGKIIISAFKQEDNVIFSVKDNGVGISENNIAKLFRIDSHFSNAGTAQERGTGLGLLLCKEFIDKHNGKIWVDSEEGIGSEFKFAIPLCTSNQYITVNINGMSTSSVI